MNDPGKAATDRGKHSIFVSLAIRINFTTTSLDHPPHTHTDGPAGDVDAGTLQDVSDVKSLADSRESGGVVVIPPKSNHAHLVRKTVACG